LPGGEGLLPHWIGGCDGTAEGLINAPNALIKPSESRNRIQSNFH
jgi:hypothetical protein